MKVWSSNRGKYYCCMKIKRKNSLTSNEQIDQKAQLKERSEYDAIYNSIVKFYK